MRQKNITFSLIAALMIFSFVGFASAGLVLDDIQFNPAIISAGDTVDVVAQFHYEASTDDDKIGNPAYDFKVELESDSSSVDDYVTILDKEGDGYKKIYGSVYYNQVFRIKISESAPTGDYEFQLFGQWFKGGISQSSRLGVKFVMPVKKEGVSLDVAALSTTPAEVRSGDDFVRIITQVENSGEKDAKSVGVTLVAPEGFSPSYGNNNRVWAGAVTTAQSKEVVFNVDVDESVRGGVYDFKYIFEYKDADNNVYTKERIVPFYVKPKSQIEVIEVIGSANQGSTSMMYVTIKNTGEETAEAVDVRVLKQSSQPFQFDVRSDYVGELTPNETGVAIFEVVTDNNADVKEHDLKLLIRAKGDSDSGDNNIYTFNRRAKFEVTKRLINPFVLIGVVGFLFVLFYFSRNKEKIKSLRKKK
ncbi:MAG: hypothetical protein PF542_00565 [Nanoarchaeota archaeon]|jgi:hypothetical protein|nr:hypothetical protein [Nanoarchaeota archaeon]